jgi:hypothetical protein
MRQVQQRKCAVQLVRRTNSDGFWFLARRDDEGLARA